MPRAITRLPTLVRPQDASLADAESRVLSTAVAQVADAWDLTNAELASVLGISPASASRLRAGTYKLRRVEKAFELGQVLVRAFRGLDALTGSDDRAARSWLRTRQVDLDPRPITLIATIGGLMRVADLIDAYRARV
jgi:uncharacterized protein (DUF2384 family)